MIHAIIYRDSAKSFDTRQANNQNALLQMTLLKIRKIKKQDLLSKVP